MVQADSENGPDPWVSIADNVGTGSPVWLGLAARFEPFVDGVYGEGLDGAVAFALRKNPAGVLKLLKGQSQRGFTIAKTCSAATFDEISRLETAQLLEQTRAAVKNVSDSSVLPAKNACLKRLDETLRRVRQTPELAP